MSIAKSTTALATVLLVSAAAPAGCKSGGSQTRDDQRATADRAESGDQSDKSAQELFIDGNRHLDRRQWQKAIESYRSALEKDDQRWDIYLNLGIAYSNDGDFENAIDAIEKSMARGGDERPEVYYNLGNVYQKRGMYDQAIKAYRTSLSYRDRLDVDTLINIGGALTILGDRKAARRAYERAQEKAPRDPRIQHGLAILHYLDGEYQAAVEAYQQLHSMAPEYAPAYYDKARPLLELDRTRDAIDALEKYLELAPDGDHAEDARQRIKTYREELEDQDPQ